jgi:hypothetical protein
MALMGSQPFSGRVWTPGVKISGMNSPAEEWVVDPALPPLGTDPRYPSSDQIAIPRGRILSVRPDTTSYTGKAVLTIADGVNNKPGGYTETNILRQWEERIQWMPNMSRQEFIEVPYVAAVNAAYGTLYAGDKITAYYGSATSRTVVAPQDKGKIVKWMPKTIYCAHAEAATGSIALSSAAYSPFTPTVILAMNAGTVLSSGASVSVSWNATAKYWVANFAGLTVTDVVYSFGQNADQIAGEVIRNEPITAAHHLSGWLEWVTDNFLAWEYPPQLMRVPTTDVTTETPTTKDASIGWYRLANAPVAAWKNASVYVTGTLTNLDGSQTTLTATELSTSGLPFLDYSMGTYYNINVVTGDLYISTNISVSSVTVSYSYETSYRDGRLWNPGVQQLTDGRFTGVPGTPANLELASVVGSLRCIIY